MQAAPDNSQDFVVLRVDDCWTIFHSGRRWGRFGFRVDAEEAAIRLAIKAQAAQVQPRVYVQSPAGELMPLRVA